MIRTISRIAPRHLLQVLSEIAAAQRDFDIHCHDRFEELCLDRLDALQDEARAMIETATGVSWSAISGASL